MVHPGCALGRKGVFMARILKEENYASSVAQNPRHLAVNPDELYRHAIMRKCVDSRPALVWLAARKIELPPSNLGRSGNRAFVFDRPLILCLVREGETCSAPTFLCASELIPNKYSAEAKL